jgi:polyhydroxyalkanoate synthesis regulator phasin
MVDLRDSVREIWSQALVGLGVAEAELEQLLTRVSDAIGLPAEEMKQRAHEFGEQLTSQCGEIERTIDEAVHRAISHIRLPTTGEVETMKQRLDQIAGRIEAIAKKRGDAN